MIVEAQPCHRPDFIPKPRPRASAKRKGLAFQRKIGHALRALACGRLYEEPWFVYSFGGKPHWCSPDFLIELPNRMIIVEAKLTWKPGIDSKLLGLYRPVVEKTFDLPVCSVLVVRNLTAGAPVPVTLEEAVRSPLPFSFAQEFI